MKHFQKQIICHLFYGDEGLDVVQHLAKQRMESAFFLFNIHPENPAREEITAFITSNFEDQVILTLPPKGRDIGAKFMLIDLALQLGIESDFTLIIHDKKSPHLENGGKWRRELFRIVSRPHLERVMRIFQQEEKVGVIGTGMYIQDEYIPVSKTFSCNSNAQLHTLIRKYNIQTHDFSYVAGNIFWIRTALLKNFFSERSILDIRKDLESGNALDFSKGTFIHAWERAMSWIATSQEFSIYGI